jgi:Ran GTPase-activating protein (RanGAP) involved in mRNA processing and transport
MLELGKCAAAATTLHKLSLDACQISSSGFSILCEGLSKNQTLRHLTLSNNGISDDSSAFLADLVKYHRNLVYLDLNYNHLRGRSG